ncbi:threonine-phosphate decarboxylase [Methanococcoides orientis]|uniref:threonine-phosphate decarboxylase CobD n=1 Tax=Methanococcoides orientis TaxID=2822137 RepID=UPI001E3CAC17|nr:threonine-phosphate decarboxylase CobD [Methanococcoides orientis]UGV40668.1 threonine-phosphate decarboxylase [Methanococcoides orientis]
MSHKKQIPLKDHVVELACPAHGGLIREMADRYGIPESDMLDLSASLNPLGSPFDHPSGGLDLDDVMERAAQRFAQYPDNRYLEYRSAAVNFLGNGLSVENIVPGNGSCEIIRLVAEAVLEHDDIVLIPHPTFAEYEQQCKVAGADVRYIKQEEVMGLSDEVLESAKLLFVCNPNNPSGKLRKREDLLDLARRCELNHTLLFVDEAFIELADDPSQSIADMVENNDHLFILRSLTKDFAIPGVRIGFGVASKRMAEALNTARLSWNLGSIPEEIGVALMNMEGGCDSPYLVQSREAIKKDREYLIERISRIRKFIPIDTTINYILVDISNSSFDSTELTERLASHGVLIRDCSSFPFMGKDYVRIAVRPKEETDRLSRAIGKVVVEKARENARFDLICMLESGDAKPQGPNTDCPYYPCHHFPGQDCTFCFCPFYKCEDERTGGKWVDRSSGGKVWSCEDCVVVHQKDVVENILNELSGEGQMDDKLKKAWTKVVEPVL